MSERPIIDDLTLSRLDRAVLALGLGTTVATVAAIAALWNRIPVRVPMHFGVSGAVDSWSDRGVLVFLLAVVIPVNLLLLALLRLPQLYNYPVKVTEANARALYTAGRRLIVFVIGIVNATFSSVAVISVGVAAGLLTKLPVWWMPSLFIAIAALLVTSLRSMRAAALARN